ncbi:MAG: hypothetical protein AAB727_01300 [Patescibacteria group bacterium]
MKLKVREKQEAVTLRRSGYSYNDILKKIPVAKSTLSLWLKDLPLTKEEKQYLKKRKDSNINRGRIKAATAHRRNRIEKEKLIREEAKKEFKKFIKDPLFHTGVALYWAEGTKRGDMFQFSNSDSAMTHIMLCWIEKFLKRKRSEIFARLYMHKPYAHEEWEKYWAKEINIPLENFKKTVFKPTGLLVKKRPNYKGCLRVELPKSTKDRVKIIFWIKMFIEYSQNQRYTQ